MTNLTFIGMPSSGKSNLGKLLAEKIGYKFIDGDSLITQKTGLTLQEIIDSKGEDEFLNIEKEILLKLSGNNYIFSPGGSSVLSEEVMSHLKKISKIIYIDVAFEDIKQRLEKKKINERGIVGLKNMTLKELYDYRHPLYEKYADLKLTFSNKSKEENLKKLIKEASSLIKMKYIIILGDGMADDPKLCNDGKTPLMIAKKPNIDSLAKKGRVGELITISNDLPAESTVANMSVLGYDVHKCYQGRGVLEAASMGVEIKKGEVAMRCNLICVENEKIKNHSAGHITSSEAKVLIDFLNKELGNDNINFFNGVSYRHLLVLKKGASTKVDLTPPHDVPGELMKKVLPKAISKDGEKTSELLKSLILKSQEILLKHPINVERKKQGKDMANSVWPWSIGVKPEMERFDKKFGVSGAVISAVDLIKGIGVYAGLKVIDVKGATGLYDTNYGGKADACIEALKTNDFVYVHVEASDEAGHEGNFDLKVKTIEYLDKRLIGRILEKLKDTDYNVRIAVLPDHPTPAALKTHTRDAVPFLITNLNDNKNSNMPTFNEITAKKGTLGVLKGDEFIKELFNRR